VYTLAHLSDIHLSPMPRSKRRHLLSKRLLGYVNWHRGRKYVHRREILDLVTRDLLAQKPDHIAVTGDLVNLGLPEEFLRAGEWLHQLGPPDRVTAIPGNHDAYVRMHPERGTHHWRAYMQANPEGEVLVPTPATQFPFVRRFGDIALVALSTAIPTMPFIASGHLGSTQRAGLALGLERLREEKLFRVVLIHHPPVPGLLPWQRNLRDARKVADIVSQHGAELVLHGHTHESSLHYLDTVDGRAAIVGVPSASEAVEGSVPAARYNLYNIARAGDAWTCEMVGRAVTGDAEHVWESERRLL
jgi:3',5'-cyclic AMP phosphodiesterase CpdA